MGCVVITGSARGFGFCQAKKFKELGYNVVISDINEELLKNSLIELEKINKDKCECISVKCDVTSVSDLENLFNVSKEKFKSVDIWVNNAGVNQPDLPCYKLSKKEIDLLIDIDLKGSIYGSNVAFKGMLEQGMGKIYNVEGYGSNDAMMLGLSLYGTSKRGLTYFTRALAKESKVLCDGNIKVCRLAPGIMITDFITSANQGNTHIELKESTKKIYNILGDYPETIVNYLVPKMISNNKNDKQIIWLSNFRAFLKIFKALFKKNNFFKEGK